MQEHYSNNNNNSQKNPLELPPGYPNTGDKTRLFNNPNQKDFQPINNEYEMENDEDIYRIRNKSIRRPRKNESSNGNGKSTKS